MKELLIKARAIIENPANWVQGVMARTKTGAETQPINPDAFSFCALGALVKSAGSFGDSLEVELYLESFTPGTISSFNDNSTHKDVLSLFDRAINCLE